MIPSRKILFSTIGLTLGLASAFAEGPRAGGDWKIRKTEWSTGDEARFSDFVAALGKAGCRSLKQCLKGPANPYRSSDPAGAAFHADCADLPYVLRAYFAWKNGLPFGYTTDVEAIPTSGSPASPTGDIRYSPRGNRPISRFDVLSSPEGPTASGLETIDSMRDVVSSAMHRIGPLPDDPKHPTDFYPADLSRGGIRPGTVIYDPDGHVAVVYAIESDGRVLYMDAHPDDSLTRGTYTKKFVRSNPGSGAGFKNWRPFRIDGAVLSAEGDYRGGKVAWAINGDLPDYSVVEYYGNRPSPDGDWRRGSFVFDGQTVDYYDYLRRALAIGTLRYDPLRELALLLRSICSDLKDRVMAVDLAVSQAISEKPHPSRLPPNIYGTFGEWEEYATPSRDARLKTSFKEAHDRAIEFVALWKKNDPSIEYRGPDLPGELRSTYATEAAACTFSYAKSDGTPSELTLDDALKRLFLLSFDPYDCPELRWGATDPRELSACRNDATKSRWYAALRRLRNQIDRTYDTKMDFTLPELEDPKAGGTLGVGDPPAVDFDDLSQPASKLRIAE